MGTLSSYFAQFDGEGTVFGSMSKKDFESIPFIEPSLQIVAAFEHMCRPIDAKVFNAESESRALSALRDTLIPKLLSGELGALQ
jgi:type I restriction enzyme S subunit